MQHEVARHISANTTCSKWLLPPMIPPFRLLTPAFKAMKADTKSMRSLLTNQGMGNVQKYSNSD